MHRTIGWVVWRGTSVIDQRQFMEVNIDVPYDDFNFIFVFQNSPFFSRELMYTASKVSGGQLLRLTKEKSRIDKVNHLTA